MSTMVAEAVDFSELAERWHRARMAAIVRVLEETSSPSPSSSSENELVSLLSDEQFEKASKAVFDNSRKLALSASRYYSVQLELEDFRKLFVEAGLPCAMGRWSVRQKAQVAERHDCPHGEMRATKLCDWYREAMDGMVMGFGENERFVRHRSAAHGDEGCLDVLFDDGPEQGEEWGYAAVPPPMLQHLTKVEHDFEQRSYKLSWLGYRAGTLFYHLVLSDPNQPLCRGTARNAHADLQRAVHEVFPTVRLHDASPLAVYGEGTR